MGGEWEEEDLILRLLIAKDRGLKTGLYSGLNEISSERLLDCLDYLKIGPYKKELGGLQNKETTNQVLYNLNTGEKINVHDSF
jgi:anaerobic ribonucleoside-triphosphate reductase activating protein